jgi:hypothetical protein
LSALLYSLNYPDMFRQLTAIFLVSYSSLSAPRVDQRAFVAYLAPEYKKCSVWLSRDERVLAGREKAPIYDNSSCQLRVWFRTHGCFLRLMRTIFRSLTGRLTRCYVSQDACGKSSLSNGIPRSGRNVWNVPGRVDKHSQPVGLKGLNDFCVRGCGSSPELYTVSPHGLKMNLERRFLLSTD